MPRRASAAPWSVWLRRWDEQQEAYLPQRERRFRGMLDVLEATIGRSGRVLDLGSGPGSLSLRILQRFPRMRCVAVDYDPVVLRIGQGALGSHGGRLTWVDAKLGRPGWTRQLPPGRYDAAVSTTALHWLAPPSLRRLYRDLGHVLRPGRVFLNGDRIPWGPEDPRLQRLAEQVRRVWLRRTASHPDRGAWRRWWKEASRAPELAEEFAEHRRRESGHPNEPGLALEVHERALRRAGFRTVATVWQYHEDRVLFAQR